MTNRYENIPIEISTESGHRVVRCTLYPPIPRKVSDLYVVTSAGERLDTIAWDFYGDVGLWWILAEANDIGRGSLSIPPGTQLRVPADVQDIKQQFTDLNRI